LRDSRRDLREGPPEREPPHAAELRSSERRCAAAGDGEYGQGGGAKRVAQDDVQRRAEHACRRRVGQQRAGEGEEMWAEEVLKREE
jgi:hypothetical protein